MKGPSRLRSAARRGLEKWRDRRLASTRLLRAFARRYPHAFAVESGANDGVQHDPLRRHLAHGHLQLSDRQACEDLVRDHGLDTLAERRGTWCLDTTIDDALMRYWRRLRPAAPAETIYVEPGNGMRT
jgi:hypothetical protein